MDGLRGIACVFASSALAFMMGCAGPSAEKPRCGVRLFSSVGDVQDRHLGLLSRVGSKDGEAVTADACVPRYRETWRAVIGDSEPALEEVNHKRTIDGIPTIGLAGPLRMTFRRNTGQVVTMDDRNAFPVTSPISVGAPAEGAERERCLRLAGKAFTDRLGCVLPTDTIPKRVSKFTSGDRAMVAIGWLMVYYGYPHLLDGFGANFDITDPDRPTVVLYGNFGSKVEPPAPDIRVSPERGWEVARQSMQEHWTRTHPGLKMDLRLLQGEEGIPKRYVYRRDLYTGDAPRNPEESHLVYVVRARAMWDPVQVGAKWPAGESRPAFEVWVDCTDAEIVGAHFVSLPPEDGGQEDEVKRWLEYRNIPSIPQSSRLRAP